MGNNCVEDDSKMDKSRFSKSSEMPKAGRSKRGSWEIGDQYHYLLRQILIKHAMNIPSFDFLVSAGCRRTSDPHARTTLLAFLSTSVTGDVCCVSLCACRYHSIWLAATK